MNVQERLGRRKEEARAGLEAARGKPPDDPAVRLAALIAGLARGGADKLTILPSPQLAAIAPLVQRLLDRVVVIVGEPLGKKSDYAIDRFFVSFALASEQHDVTYLAEAGHPVVQWKVESPGEIEARFAAVKAVLDDLLPPITADVSPMPVEPALRANGLALFAPPGHAYVLRKSAGMLGARAAESPAGWIAAQLALGDPGDHVVLVGGEDLSALQAGIRSVTGLACTRATSWVQPHPRGLYFVLGEAAAPDLPPGRALRIHTEDGDPARISEAVLDAIRMLSRK